MRSHETNEQLAIQCYNQLKMKTGIAMNTRTLNGGGNESWETTNVF